MIKPARATGLERLELHRLRDRVGRLFAALQEATVADDPLASETWAPPVDLCETADAIVVRVELPGLTAEQIKIGEMIMRRLKELDKVAYVRFASVYLEFEDVSEFMTELKHLVRTRANQAGKK